MSLEPAQIYLASQSPRRRELLSQISIDYALLSVAVNEQIWQGETPEDYVQRLALTKATVGWKSSKREMDIPVLGADTIVVLADQILEKPDSEEAAIKMLQQLSGRRHKVLTAIALVKGQKQSGYLSTSQVSFRELDKQTIKKYIASGESQDKAGAYGIQGLAAVFISQIEGSYSGVVGLPLYETANLLREFCVDVL